MWTALRTGLLRRRFISPENPCSSVILDVLLVVVIGVAVTVFSSSFLICFFNCCFNCFFDYFFKYFLHFFSYRFLYCNPPFYQYSCSVTTEHGPKSDQSNRGLASQCEGNRPCSIVPLLRWPIHGTPRSPQSYDTDREVHRIAELVFLFAGRVHHTGSSGHGGAEQTTHVFDGARSTCAGSC